MSYLRKFSFFTILVATLLSSSELYAEEWKISVHNLKTKEIKYYEIKNEAFDFEIGTSAFQCFIKPQKSDSNKNGLLVDCISLFEVINPLKTKNKMESKIEDYISCHGKNDNLTKYFFESSKSTKTEDYQLNIECIKK